MSTLTREYTVTTATVTYPDGSTENIEYVYRTCHAGTVKLTNLDFREEWNVYNGMVLGPRLREPSEALEKTILSADNFRKIEDGFEDRVVLVAEVDLGRIKRSLRHEEVEIEDQTVWEKFEWEAHKERDDD